MALRRFFSFSTSGASGSSKTSVGQSQDEVIEEEIAKEQQRSSRKRGKYESYDESFRYKVGRYAAEHGNKWALNKFKRKDGQCLSEATVRNFKRQYLEQIKSGKDLDQAILPKKQQGRPKLLPSEIEAEVKLYIERLRDKGAIVNYHIVLGVTRGILKKKRPTLYRQLDLQKAWAHSLLSRWGYSKRKGEFTLIAGLKFKCFDSYYLIKELC